MRLAVVILAAGEGTRMKSALPKVLHPICGVPLVQHVLSVANALESIRTILVLSQETLGPVQAAFGEGYYYTVQKERLGTAHAALQAHQFFQSGVDEVLVLFGDTPLLRVETARQVIQARREANALLALLSFRPEKPTGYGRVVRDAAGHVVALVEERDATQEQRLIGECNSGIMCFDAAWLATALPQVAPSPVKGEYYLTDLVAMAVAAAGPGAVLAYQASDAQEALGINDRVQLAQAETILRQRILTALMESGVTITDPTATYVDVGVRVGRDTALLPGTLLLGNTQVGSQCTIGPHTTLIDTTVGDQVSMRHVVAEHVTVASGTSVGPFAHLK